MARSKICPELHKEAKAAFKQLHPRMAKDTKKASSAFLLFRDGYQAREKDTVWPDWARRILKLLEKSGIIYDPDEEIDLADEVETLIQDWENEIEHNTDTLEKEIAELKTVQEATDALLKQAMDRMQRLAMYGQSKTGREDVHKILKAYAKHLKKQTAAANTPRAIARIAREISRATQSRQSG